MVLYVLPFDYKQLNYRMHRYDDCDEKCDLGEDLGFTLTLKVFSVLLVTIYAIFGT